MTPSERHEAWHAQNEVWSSLNPGAMQGPPVTMWDAANKGDAHVVGTWLDGGGGVDAPCAERQHMTLLMGAAMSGQVAVLRMLLQRGASINLQTSNGTTALIAAAAFGYTTTVQMLLDAKADTSLRVTNGSTALMVAEQRKQTTVEKLLRQHLKQLAAEAGAPASAAQVEAEKGAKVRVSAADAAATELLAEEAAEKEAAAKKGKGKKKKTKAASFIATAEPTEAALSAGAPKPADAQEGLPMGVREAAEAGEADVVAAWLEGGGGLDARCADGSDRTLLMVVAAGEQEAMVRMLLQRGASINLQGTDGMTALTYAAVYGHTTIVQALLDAKADALLQTSGNKTALMWAEQHKHPAIAQLLRQHAKRQAAEAEARAAVTSTPLLVAVREELPQAMYLAANKGDAQAVAAWLDEGGCMDVRSP